jgi:phosphoglycolate phosphatase-like HAD superfamily hydrolase
MENDVDAVVLECRGTLAGWSLGVEAVAYEQARLNGESPLDRGAALRRRVEHLSTAGSTTPSFAAGFARLAAERGWRRGMTGDECLRRIIALARPYADVPPALELAIAARCPLVVISLADRALVHGALRPFDGAFDAVLTTEDFDAPSADALVIAAARRMATEPGRLLYVSASRDAIARAGVLGTYRGWVNRRARGPRPAHLRPSEEWSSLLGLAEFLGVTSRTLPVAG